MITKNNFNFCNTVNGKYKRFVKIVINPTIRTNSKT